MKKWVSRIVLAASLAMVALVPVIWSTAMAARSAGQPSIIVLTASWCGTCREITPAVSRVAGSSGGLQVVTLDVDDNGTPGKASQYGVTVAGSDLPQVYLSNNGKTVLLFSGKNYKFGQSKQAEDQIRQQLQTHL